MITVTSSHRRARISISCRYRKELQIQNRPRPVRLHIGRRSTHLHQACSKCTCRRHDTGNQGRSAQARGPCSPRNLDRSTGAFRDTPIRSSHLHSPRRSTSKPYRSERRQSSSTSSLLRSTCAGKGLDDRRRGYVCIHLGKEVWVRAGLGCPVGLKTKTPSKRLAVQCTTRTSRGAISCDNLGTRARVMWEQDRRT